VVSGYLFFMVLPPIISTVDNIASYLNKFQVPVLNLEESATKIRNAAESLPSCPEERFGGCAIIDLRHSKTELNGIAESIANVDSKIQTQIGTLENQIHQVGIQLGYVEPTMIALVGWMLAVSTLLMLSGILFLLIDRSIERRLRPEKSQDARKSLAS